MNKLGINILVIDDDPFSLKLIDRVLKNLGYSSVTLCDSGRAALKQVKDPEQRPDIILLDLNMPKMDGIEFVSFLAELHYAGSLILFSGEDEHILQAAESLVQMHKITMLGSLHKPVTPEKLDELLKKWMPFPPAKVQEVEKIYSANELRAAIENGELVNFYQPIVELSSGRVTGVETLVRWYHPQDGMVFPHKFIVMAETHKLIDNLTRVVLAAALAQAKLWQEMGLRLQIAVNVSIDNLASLDFADFVDGLVTDAGVPPQRVTLEVSEAGILSNDLRAPLETLTRLRLKRFHISIDKFGSGHSSLDQLRSIPFDEIKIDKSIVHSDWSNKMEQVRYDACLVIAKQMDMKVVAVGVEDVADWDHLRHTGCDLAQGYFIAKPMHAGDLPGWIETWQSRMRE